MLNNDEGHGTETWLHNDRKPSRAIKWIEADASFTYINRDKDMTASQSEINDG